MAFIEKKSENILLNKNNQLSLYDILYLCTIFYRNTKKSKSFLV